MAHREGFSQTDNVPAFQVREFAVFVKDGGGGHHKKINTLNTYVVKQPMRNKWTIPYKPTFYVITNNKVFQINKSHK